MKRLVETTSLLILMAVVVVRPLVAESYDSASSSISQALGAGGDPSPLRTLVFDLLILCGAAGWFLARFIGTTRSDRSRTSYRWSGIELGTILIAIGAIVSCVFADNKRLAINGAIDWLCMPILTIALVQLLHTNFHRRILLAAILATAGVQAWQCFEQSLVGFSETLAHYEVIKEELWSQQGVELDSPKVAAFERRMRARAPSGFMPHSNVAASYLVLCGFAALSMTLHLFWRRRRIGSNDNAATRESNSSLTPLQGLAAVGAVLATAAIIVAAILTGSTGAFVSGGVGLMLGGILYWYRSWFVAHRTKAFALGCIAAVLGILAAVGHGLTHDSLPGWSLTFRWQYWKGSAELFSDHVLTGVGRENFGRHYLQYKSIQAPEEVANPHNLFVQAAVDWGLVGLLGMVVMVLGAFWIIVRPRSGLSGESDSSSGQGRPWRVFFWGSVLTLVVTVGRIPLLGQSDPNFVYYATVMTGLIWAAGFACFASLSTIRVPSFSMRCLIAIGLFTFLLHDMINFAAFVPATATTCFALLALCVSSPICEGSTDTSDDRTQPDPRPRLVSQLAVGALILGSMVSVVLVGIVPVYRSSRDLDLARPASTQLLPVPIRSQLADRYFQSAAEHDPFDPTPRLEHARWLAQVATLPERRAEALPAAHEALSKAIDLDPKSMGLRRMQMKLHQFEAEVTGSVDARLAAIQAAKASLAIYPEDPRGMVDLADRQAEAAETSEDQSLWRAAVENYSRALDLDDSRPLWAKLAGFSPGQRIAIEKKLDRAGLHVDH